MADKSSQLILDALSRAVADPAGLPLYAGKKVPGLFGASAAARQIAQRCKDEGYLRSVRTEPSGRNTHEYCAITEKGLAHLLSQVSPKQVLEDLIRCLDARQVQVGELVTAARQWQSGLDALQATVHKVLQEIQVPGGDARSMPRHVGGAPPSNGSEVWVADAIAHLHQWRDAGKSSDCPLPDLFRRALQQTPDLSIGRFHDALRKLYDKQKLYLHPWSGPLYEIPEPQYALLIGHEIVYYVSIR